MKTVKKLGNGRFFIDDKVMIHRIRIEDNGIRYSLDYEESEISEENACALADEFMQETFNGIISQNQKEELESSN